MAPSWVFFGFILLGGATAVAGTTLYPIAREKEKSAVLARDVKNLLVPELQSNLLHANQIIELFNQDRIPALSLKATAWETVSKGSLLNGLKSNEISELLAAYDYIYLSISLQNRYMENRFGVNASIVGAVDYQKSLIEQIKGNLANVKQYGGQALANFLTDGRK